jgi:hypothetical protein
MVEPFTNSRSWYRLVSAVGTSLGRVFKQYPNLEAISVASSKIVDHPSPTVTYAFILCHGKSVIWEPGPPFVQDDTVNTAWASLVVLRTMPPTIRSLRLSLANMDNFHSFSTVNRLIGDSNNERTTPCFSDMERSCPMSLRILSNWLRFGGTRRGMLTRLP